MKIPDKTKYWLVTVFLLVVLIGAAVGVCTLGAPLGQAVGPRDFTITQRHGGVTLTGAVEDDRLKVLCIWADGFTRQLAERYGVEAPTVTIRLLPNKREFQSYGQRHISGFHEGIDFCYSRREQIIYGYLGPSERIQTRFKHEIMHRLVHQRLPKLPLWLDEGLAELAETLSPTEDFSGLTIAAVQKERMRIAAVLRDDSSFNPGKLSATTGTDFSGQHLNSWYSLAYAVVLVLERQQRLGKALAAGETVLAQNDFSRFVSDPDQWSLVDLKPSGVDPSWHLVTVR